jgi:hypothetical protein
MRKTDLNSEKQRNKHSSSHSFLPVGSWYAEAIQLQIWYHSIKKLQEAQLGGLFDNTQLSLLGSQSRELLNILPGNPRRCPSRTDTANWRVG